jgi:peroxiredoxin
LKTVGLLAFAFALLVIIVPLGWAASDQWSLPDTKGETFKFADDSTRTPTLLIFWATWCIPCKKEMSDNKALFTAYEKRGVSVLLISEDNARTSSKVKPYVESKRFTQRVLLDATGEVMKRYGGSALPFTVLLDGQDNVVEKFPGAIKDTDALTKQIDQLLEAAQ